MANGKPKPSLKRRIIEVTADEMLNRIIQTLRDHGVFPINTQLTEAIKTDIIVTLMEC